MNKLKWWLIVVGVFYLLLTLMNLYFLFVTPDYMTGMLPPPMAGNALAGRAFADAWLVFVFELGVLGAVMLYAARDLKNSKLLVWAVIGAEIFRGIVADAVWIARGYAAAEYIPFIVIHLIIIATGVVFVRQAFAEA